VISRKTNHFSKLIAKAKASCFMWEALRIQEKQFYLGLETVAAMAA